MAKNLTKKQEIFCTEYCADGNATRAAIAAGYSEKSAAAQALILLKIPKVQARISRATEADLDYLAEFAAKFASAFYRQLKLSGGPEWLSKAKVLAKTDGANRQHNREGMDAANSTDNSSAKGEMVGEGLPADS